MRTLLFAVSLLSLLAAAASWLRPRSRAGRILFWPFKLLGGGLGPILGAGAALGAVVGLARGDRRLAATGVLGAGLAARLAQDVPDLSDQFAAEFGPDWRARLPDRRQPARVGKPAWRRDLTYGQSAGGEDLLADLWEPPPGAPRTGVGVLFIHGGGWRTGFKDMGTRPFFRRLARQGHVVLDIAYSLWPKAGIPGMVAEVWQAVRWLEAYGPERGVDPVRIVLMGGSAGGHLALLAAYTPGLFGEGNSPVAGAVAFYPPTDLEALYAGAQATHYKVEDGQRPGLVERLADRGLAAAFQLNASDLETPVQFGRFIPALVGCEPAEAPETYRRLSPLAQVGPHCPPTLLLQGSDDMFGLAPQVGDLHQALRRAGVPVVWAEFPHADHAFDMVLPQVSVPARVATHAVEWFLAQLSPPGN